MRVCVGVVHNVYSRVPPPRLMDFREAGSGESSGRIRAVELVQLLCSLARLDSRPAMKIRVIMFDVAGGGGGVRGFWTARV